MIGRTLSHQEILDKLGRYDTALEELDAILALPGVISIPILELDPRWQALRAHPAFAKLVNK